MDNNNFPFFTPFQHSISGDTLPDGTFQEDQWSGTWTVQEEDMGWMAESIIPMDPIQAMALANTLNGISEIGQRLTNLDWTWNQLTIILDSLTPGLEDR
jgi:hypothetical protein